MAMTLAVFVGHGAPASRVGARVIRSPDAVRRVQPGFAGVFAVAGLRLASEDR